jgi:hypothetical protein
MTYKNATDVPAWAEIYSMKIKKDAAELWGELVGEDVEAEGDFVQAFFAKEFYPLSMEFTGISVEDATGHVTYWDKDRIYRVFGTDGWDMICKLEEVAMEREIAAADPMGDAADKAYEESV